MTGRELRVLLCAPALGAVAGCRGIQTMLDPAADQARDIDLIWRTMLIVCGVMYVLVLVFLALALWRARARRTMDAQPAAGRTPAEPLLERSLVSWTALIVAGLILLVTVSFLVDRSLTRPAGEPLHIRITAHQWWWQVDYAGAPPSQIVSTANELHLPLGRPVVIALVADDVIHSFWAPNLAGKVDLIPGRTNYVTLTPRRLGTFRGQCAEFCGLQHAKMAFDVTVEPPAQFDAWRAAQLTPAALPQGDDEWRGRQVFEQKACAMCHRIQGTEASATVAPDLTHLKSRSHIAAGARPNTRGDLQAWIADPQDVKPGTNMPRVPLTAQELNDVTSYLERLK